MAKHVGDLPNAATHGDELARRLSGKEPAVFLDYDGTLTPIVDRPEDALISESMRDAVRGLARRCPACVEGCLERIVEDDPHEEASLRGLWEEGDDRDFVLEALKDEVEVRVGRP